ncbi:serine acetyltransferase [Microbacterium testaceum]|uniref:serine O-acetyltransferase n=1 Tax=Microbacterium testaceum TaxID=2033 RepID=UPI002786D505|nr:hypothetical protein [Microbacterium testaceum]MDQ1174264.1 serine acetyltransferase [Microbacterium testaceum]
MDVVPGAQVGLGLMIHHPVGIVVGRGVKVGDGCTILQGVTLGERHADGSGLPIYPQIRDRCTIGANAVILGDVSVGPNSTVGASALVIKDVPENCVAVGVPARSIPLKHVAAATERKAHND